MAPPQLTLSGLAAQSRCCAVAVNPSRRARGAPPPAFCCAPAGRAFAFARPAFARPRLASFRAASSAGGTTGVAAAAAAAAAVATEHHNNNAHVEPDLTRWLHNLLGIEDDIKVRPRAPACSLPASLSLCSAARGEASSHFSFFLFKESWHKLSP